MQQKNVKNHLLKEYEMKCNKKTVRSYVQLTSHYKADLNSDFDLQEKRIPHMTGVCVMRDL